LKRRVFLASLLPLAAAPQILSAPVKTRKKAAKPRSKKPRAKPAVPQTTAKNSVLDAAHPGTSATRLPPVKAFELPQTWRAFAVTTTLRLLPTPERQRLWLPLPRSPETPYQRDLGCAWQGNFTGGRIIRLPDELEAFYCEWPGGVEPELEFTSHVATAERHFDISRRTLPPEREDLLRRHLAASRQIPNDGAALALAREIVGRIIDPVAQAHALFNWITQNAKYDPQLPPRGDGDVRQQIATRQFTGRSATISGLFVALCRAIGIPARRVFGLRIAPSQVADSLGIQMGAGTAADATLAAHCRAEFYVPGYRWIPVDPADVLRATTLEALPLAREIALRKLLFGLWEMNWMAYNTAEAPSLPDNGPQPPFFARPILATPEGESSDVACHITSQTLPIPWNRSAEGNPADGDIPAP
jgi:hypothetical protein